MEESTCRTPEQPIEAVEVGLKRWFASGGGLQPLPSGIAPAEARWAASLKGRELEIAGRSSPSLLRAHMDGRDVIAGVRPVVVSVSDEAEQEKRKARVRARGAHTTAVLARTKATYEERVDREAALAM